MMLPGLSEPQRKISGESKCRDRDSTPEPAAYEFQVYSKGFLDGNWMRLAHRAVVSLCFMATALPAIAQQFTVISVSPAPESQTTSSPASVSIAFSANVDPATLTPSTIMMIEAGPDALFNTGDDVTITPTSITVTGASVTLDLTGLTLPLGSYRIKVSGTGVVPTPASGLYARWKLDEGTGLSVADSSGNGRTGALNGPTWTSGLFGKALSFGGGVPRVDIDAGIIVPDWTVTMWVLRNGDVEGTAATLMDSNSQYGTSLRLEQVAAANQVGITEYTTVDYGFGYVAPLGTWVHLAFSSSGSNAQLHVNGVLTNTSSRGFNLHLDKLGSARANVTDSLTGLLSEVQVYTRVLSGAEIASLAALTGCVRNATGDVLDGEFTSVFPSGNGMAGGDFASTFAIVPDVPSGGEEGGGGGDRGGSLSNKGAKTF